MVFVVVGLCVSVWFQVCVVVVIVLVSFGCFLFHFILFYFFFSVCFFVFFPDVKSKLDRKVLEGHGTDPIYYISTTTVAIPIKHGLVII